MYIALIISERLTSTIRLRDYLKLPIFKNKGV